MRHGGPPLRWPGTAAPERATVVSTWQDLSCCSDRTCPRNGGFNDLNVARICPTVPNPDTCRSLSALSVRLHPHQRGKPRKMSREYAVALGARLRAVRRQHGMTLQQVHQRSGNRWSPLVLGSYERADRAMSVTTPGRSRLLLRHAPPKPHPPNRGSPRPKLHHRPGTHPPHCPPDSPGPRRPVNYRLEGCASFSPGRTSPADLHRHGGYRR